MIFNSPCHNPTGYSLDEREWAESVRILRAAARRGAVAFLNDFAYAKLRRRGRSASGSSTRPRWSGRWCCWWPGPCPSRSRSTARASARWWPCTPIPSERRRIFNALSFSCRGTWSNCNHLGLLAIERLLSDPDLCARSRSRARAPGGHAGRARRGLQPARRPGRAAPTRATTAGSSSRSSRPIRRSPRPSRAGAACSSSRSRARCGSALCSTSAAQVPELVHALAEGLAAARR